MFQPRFSFARRLLVVLILFSLALFAGAQQPTMTMPDVTPITTGMSTLSCSLLGLGNNLVWATIIAVGIFGAAQVAFNKNNRAQGFITLLFAAAAGMLMGIFVATPNLTAPLGGCNPFGGGAG